MTEWRMAEVVAQRAGFGQVLVEAERAGKRARDLGHFERVRQSRAVMIAFVEHEHLGFVSEPTERGRMDDAVAIAPEIAARCAPRLVIEASVCQCRIGRIGRTGRHFGTSPAVDWGLPRT